MTNSDKQWVALVNTSESHPSLIGIERSGMYEVMAVAGAVWSYPYAWKGPALVTLGREINENKWLGERIGALKRGFVTLPPP